MVSLNNKDHDEDKIELFSECLNGSSECFGEEEKKTVGGSDKNRALSQNVSVWNDEHLYNLINEDTTRKLNRDTNIIAKTSEGFF